MSIPVLNIIILACTMNGNLNKKCLDVTLDCVDVNFSQTLRLIKGRSLAYCIQKGVK